MKTFYSKYVNFSQEKLALRIYWLLFFALFSHFYPMGSVIDMWGIQPWIIPTYVLKGLELEDFSKEQSPKFSKMIKIDSNAMTNIVRLFFSPLCSIKNFSSKKMFILAKLRKNICISPKLHFFPFFRVLCTIQHKAVLYYTVHNRRREEVLKKISQRMGFRYEVQDLCNTHCEIYVNEEKWC